MANNKARITVNIDPNKLLPAVESAIPVAGIADYIPACLAIRQVLNSGDKAITMHVTNGLVGDWLKEIAQTYGEEHIRCKTYTARIALQEKWNIVIPDLRDGEIIWSGLLKENILPREGQTFENVVLENLFHDFFAFPAFSSERLPGWLNELDLARWEDYSRRPIIGRLLRERLDTWKNRENNSARRSLVEMIVQNPARLRDILARYKILQKYPDQLQEKVLGEDAAVFRRAGINPDDLNLQGVDLKPAITELEYYLTPLCQSIQDTNELDQLLDMVSGYLVQEFNYIESILQHRPDWITAERLHLIERRFSPTRAGIETRLMRLRSLIPAKRPETPDGNWGAVQWLEWVRDSYSPYLRWLEAAKKYDEEIAGYAATFADWYYDHVIQLKNGAPEHFAFSSLYLDRQRMIQGDTISLVVLLDNFNYTFFAELRRLFNRQNVSLMFDRPVFSLPPTATEVGKAAIVSVTGNLTEIDGKDYSSLVAKYWGQPLSHSGKTAKYLGTIGELQQMARQEHDLYFLNFLPVDNALHASTQEIGQDHSTVVAGHLNTLINSIVEFARRFHLEERLVIYIIADHGSTRISKNEINVLDQKWYKGIADLKHHRYIAISDQQVAQLPQMATAQCYLIERNRFETNRNYLAARAYYRFIETSEDFYVHGGLTPEEVVVPFARFEFQPIQIAAPTVRLVKDRFRLMVKSVIEIELGNPNDYMMENVTARLVGAPADDVFIATLSPKQMVTIRLGTVFKKEPGVGKTRNLSLRLQYDCQERTCSPVDVPIQVTVESMMETTDDFEF